MCRIEQLTQIANPAEKEILEIIGLGVELKRVYDDCEVIKSDSPVVCINCVGSNNHFRFESVVAILQSLNTLGFAIPTDEGQGLIFYPTDWVSLDQARDILQENEACSEWSFLVGLPNPLSSPNHLVALGEGSANLTSNPLVAAARASGNGKIFGYFQLPENEQLGKAADYGCNEVVEKGTSVWEIPEDSELLVEMRSQAFKNFLRERAPLLDMDLKELEQHLALVSFKVDINHSSKIQVQLDPERLAIFCNINHSYFMVAQKVLAKLGFLLYGTGESLSIYKGIEENIDPKDTIEQAKRDVQKVFRQLNRAWSIVFDKEWAQLGVETPFSVKVVGVEGLYNVGATQNQALYAEEPFERDHWAQLEAVQKQLVNGESLQIPINVFETYAQKYKSFLLPL